MHAEKLYVEAGIRCCKKVVEEVNKKACNKSILQKDKCDDKRHKKKWEKLQNACVATIIEYVRISEYSVTGKYQ